MLHAMQNGLIVLAHILHWMSHKMEIGLHRQVHDYLFGEDPSSDILCLGVMAI